MTEKDKLLKEQTEGEALESMKNHQGYPVLIGLFKEIYMDSLENLITAEDAEARSEMKALEKILEMIDRSITLAGIAKEELTKERFK